MLLNWPGGQVEKSLLSALGFRELHFLFQVDDPIEGKFCIAGYFFYRISFFQEIPRDFFPTSELNHGIVYRFHLVRHKIPRTKITQFHFFLQYPEHRVRYELPEIGFAIERVDGTEAGVTCERQGDSCLF